MFLIVDGNRYHVFSDPKNHVATIVSNKIKYKFHIWDVLHTNRSQWRKNKTHVDPANAISFIRATKVKDY